MLLISLLHCVRVEVLLQTVTGKATSLRVEDSDTIENFKLKIQDKEGILQDRQRLVYAGQQLEDWQTLQDCNIQNESLIYLLIGKTIKHSVHNYI